MADFLNLSELPYVVTDTQDAARQYLRGISGHRFCYSCFGLYPVVLSHVAPLGGISVNDFGDNTLERLSPFEATLGSRDWFTWQFIYFKTYQIQKPLPEIDATATTGCVTCMLIKDLIIRLTNNAVAFDDPLLFVELVLCRGHALTLAITRGTEEDEEGDVLFFSTGPKETERVFGPYHIYTLLVKSFPKRIISIGPASNNEIRVVEHDDSSPPPQEPYIALSHCWGKSRPLTLTRDTMAQRKANIPFEALPRTFRDAVLITRGLGIRYIWIDSLCIIQNDTQDWEIEAAKMSSIYSGAELVLSATGSGDSTAGVLQNRKPFLTWTGSYPKDKPFHIYGRQIIQHDAFGWGQDEREMVKGSTNLATKSRPLSSGDFPLMTRAWCFQERLLATAILHFTKDEIVFDCLTSMECECGTLTRHEGDSHLALRRIIKTGHKYVSGLTSLSQGLVNPYVIQNSEAVEEPDFPDGFVEHHERWRDLIVQYSQKGITVTTDRLPAVGGLALRWCNDLTGRYLAGLWEKDLLRGLRWWPSEAQTDLDEDPPYVAPTWSWVNARRGVTWGTQSFEGTLSFINIDLSRTQCHLGGLNPYGQVDYGYIFLTGRVMEVDFSVDRTMISLKKLGDQYTLENPDSTSGLQKLGNCKLYCLRLCTKIGTGNAWDDDYALVLKRAQGKDLAIQPKEVRECPNVYQRVGLWTAYRVRSWNHAQDSVKEDMYLI
ncbi:hypothetical protein QQZ08_009372 [Neonectria magnoliae]|uniref:Heterokaryon incompatibility domain-containing protein n=1 Tax=Neonectria magnoliae TaxID=2732573 RepID=A0ABR1HPU5_9HYPO